MSNTLFKKKKSLSKIAIVFIVAALVSAVLMLTAFKSISLPKTLSKKTSIGIGGMSRGSDILYADPWKIFSEIKGNTFKGIIVDMRGVEDYSRNHLKYSVNIPFDNQKEFINDLKALKQEEIILMPYSLFSTSGEEAYILATKKGIRVSLLKIGWNEFYNLPNMWVPGDNERFSIEEIVE